ncbi:MAG: hypothetical protein L3J12_10520, partial [Spirochaetales bacterium]|nr:hypothetical protein [Spirochaetales bacterium]
RQQLRLVVKRPDQNGCNRFSTTKNTTGTHLPKATLLSAFIYDDLLDLGRVLERLRLSRILELSALTAIADTTFK